MDDHDAFASPDAAGWYYDRSDFDHVRAGGRRACRIILFVLGRECGVSLRYCESLTVDAGLRSFPFLPFVRASACLPVSAVS